MSFFRLYGRVLALLRPEARSVAILLAAAIGLVATQFAEPVLLGRLINALTGAATPGHLPSLAQLTPPCWFPSSPTASPSGVGSPSWRCISSTRSSCR